MLSDDDYEFPEDDANYSDNDFEDFVASPNPKKQEAPQLPAKKPSINSGFDDLQFEAESMKN